MVTPHRGLSRSLLKALLLEGVSSSQPLYSIGMSYAMQLALGGAGYRPSEDSPLRPLQAGLVELVSTINGMAGGLGRALGVNYLTLDSTECLDEMKCDSHEALIEAVRQAVK